MTIDELRARKRELLAEKRRETEALERGEGDEMALFLIKEELLDVTAQLRALAPAGERPIKSGTGSLSTDAGRFNPGDRQQFIQWAQQETEDDGAEMAAEANAEARRMIELCMTSITGRQREVLLLHADGMKQVEIAEKLGVNRSSVNRTLRRAKMRAADIAEAQETILRLRDGDRLDMSNPEAVKTLMYALTPHQAVCFYLYYAEYLTFRQIGDLLNVDHVTVFRTVRRAVERINDILCGAVEVLDCAEGMDDVVFAIYCGMDKDELPPIPEPCPYAPPPMPEPCPCAPPPMPEPCPCAPPVCRRDPRIRVGEWKRLLTSAPPFLVAGLPGTERGTLEFDQHGRLYQALFRRFRDAKSVEGRQCTHPIARWLLKIFSTITRPFSTKAFVGYSEIDHT